MGITSHWFIQPKMPQPRSMILLNWSMPVRRRVPKWLGPRYSRMGSSTVGAAVAS